jgi:hypothetical protein
MPDILNRSDQALAESRAKLFSLLLLRLRALRAARPAPSSYYGGQEYIEDEARIDCTISFILLYPGHVQQFEFWLHGTRVDVRQLGSRLLVQAHRKISEHLWDDLRLLAAGEQFIVGYVKNLMPKINRYLLDNRYMEGIFFRGRLLYLR